MTGARNTIRSWALGAVAVTSAFLIAVATWLIYLLGVSDWCQSAIGATKGVARPDSAVAACFDLLKMQVGGLTQSLLIVLYTFALCLAVLVVIVLAGGKLSFKAPGVEADVSHDPGEAAQTVADAAQSQADAVKGGS